MVFGLDRVTNKSNAATIPAKIPNGARDGKNNASIQVREYPRTAPLSSTNIRNLKDLATSRSALTPSYLGLENALFGVAL